MPQAVLVENLLRSGAVGNTIGWPCADSALEAGPDRSASRAHRVVRACPQDVHSLDSTDRISVATVDRLQAAIPGTMVVCRRRHSCAIPTVRLRHPSTTTVIYLLEGNVFSSTTGAKEVSRPGSTSTRFSVDLRRRVSHHPRRLEPHQVCPRPTPWPDTRRSVLCADMSPTSNAVTERLKYNDRVWSTRCCACEWVDGSLTDFG